MILFPKELANGKGKKFTYELFFTHDFENLEYTSTVKFTKWPFRTDEQPLKYDMSAGTPTESLGAGNLNYYTIVNKKLPSSDFTR